MKITAKEITKQLQVFWPNLKDVWPMDREFWCPTYKELRLGLGDIKKFREEAKVCFMLSSRLPFPSTYIDQLHDCDNFALELQADISRYRFIVAQNKAIPPLELLSWAFGTILCIRVKGREINHTLNICITSDAGIVFIEPQDFSMWKADRKKDQPYFVEMR